MKQPEFGIFFNSDIPRKIKYQIRFDANLLHDIAYLASYIHDSRFKLESIKHIKKRLIIPLDRDCWEMNYEKNGEIMTSRSKLTIFPVKSFSFVITERRLEKGFLRGHDKENNIWISNIFLSDDYYTNNEDFNFVLMDRTGFKFIVNITGPTPQIKLEDLTPPLIWKERTKLKKQN